MRRILVADDDASARETLVRMLASSGYEAVVAASGAETLRTLEVSAPDLALLDLRLGDMTALDVLTQLRAKGDTTPCIIVTGFGTIDSAVRAMKLGAVNYVTKPVLRADLAQRVGAVFDSQERSVSAARDRVDGLRRWAGAVFEIVCAEHDIRSIDEWSELLKVAPATLRSWCRTVDIAPKRTRDLGRVLRAARLARSTGLPVSRFFDVADHRTLHRLLRMGGLSAGERSPLTLRQVLFQQRLVSDPAAITELRLVLTRKSDPRSDISD